MSPFDSSDDGAKRGSMTSLSGRRDSLAALASECRLEAAKLRALAAQVPPAPVPIWSNADETAWKAAQEPDAAATEKARHKARRDLRERLPTIADELQRLSVAVRDGHASLNEADSLQSLAAVFESLHNSRGVLSEETCGDMGEAIDLARGTAYVQRNGDVAYDRGRKVAS